MNTNTDTMFVEEFVVVVVFSISFSFLLFLIFSLFLFFLIVYLFLSSCFVPVLWRRLTESGETQRTRKRWTTNEREERCVAVVVVVVGFCCWFLVFGTIFLHLLLPSDLSRSLFFCVFFRW